MPNSQINMSGNWGPRPGMGGTHGGAFIPTQISGLALWLDAADASTLFQDSGLTTPAMADTDPVGGWKDKSGQGNTPTGAGGTRPILKLNIQNGRPVVRFTAASSQVLTLGSLVGFATDPYTAFVVFKLISTGANQTILNIGADPGGRQTSVSNTNKFKNGRTVQANYAIGATTLGAVVFQVGTSIDDDINANVYLNGTLDGGPTASAGNYTGGALFVGARSAAEFFGGDIAEIVAYNSALGASQLTQVQRYLGSKWGITVA